MTLKYSKYAHTGVSQRFPKINEYYIDRGYKTA